MKRKNNLVILPRASELSVNKNLPEGWEIS